jgi:hypothetical protein
MAISSNYLTTIPNAKTLESVDQPNILANFQAINSWVTQNHTALTTATNAQGMHTVISFPNQSVVPAVPFGVESFDLFSATSATTTVPEMTLVRTPVGTNIQKSFPVTASIQFSTGYTLMMSGMMIKWGIVPVVSQPPETPIITITFPLTVLGETIPAFARIAQVFLTSYDAEAVGSSPGSGTEWPEIVSINTGGFVLSNVNLNGITVATPSVGYLAIGFPAAVVP